MNKQTFTTTEAADGRAAVDETAPGRLEHTGGDSAAPTEVK